MDKSIIEIKSSFDLPLLHRQKAEEKAKQAYILSLLEQGDLNIEETCCFLGISQEDLIELALEYNISTVELDAIRLGIETDVLTQMEHQSELFKQMHSHLFNQYEGKWVAFADGQVLDADEDETVLTKRVFQAYPDTHLLIKKVVAEDIQLKIRTPFLSSLG